MSKKRSKGKVETSVLTWEQIEASRTPGTSRSVSGQVAKKPKVAFKASAPVKEPKDGPVE